ncbi:MAG: hypothetical protein FWH05_00205 [Oscillospiraceae bacterium]|nr:hypothetical protein [Oscillospiraceae bacterium]
MNFYELLKDTRQALENFNQGATAQLIQNFIDVGEDLYTAYIKLSDEEKSRHNKMSKFRKDYVDFCVVIQRVVNKGGELDKKSQESLVSLSNSMLKIVWEMLTDD